MVTRKAVPPKPTVEDDDPSSDYERRDSWELDYTDDEDERAGPQSSQAPNRTTVQGGTERTDFAHAPQKQGIAAQYTGPPASQPSDGFAQPLFGRSDAAAGAGSSGAGQPGEEERMNDVPEALRPGGNRAATNPFLRKKVPERSDAVPTEGMAQLSVQKTGTNPFQPALSSQSTGSAAPVQLPLPSQADNNPWASPSAPAELSPQHNYTSPIQPLGNPWESSPPIATQTPTLPPPPVPHSDRDSWVPDLRQRSPAPTSPVPPAKEALDNYWDAQTSTPPPQPPAQAPLQPPLQPPLIPSPAIASLPSDDDSPWADAPQQKSQKVYAPPPGPPPPKEPAEEENIWDDLGALDKGKSKAPAVPPGGAASSQIEDWNLIDVEPESGSAGPAPKDSAPVPEGVDGPPLPPRQSTENMRFTSPRPPVDSKSETYQVKNIRWFDANTTQNPRVSPILVQNANGPCPLVALVNALSMTTPPDVTDSAMVEILRSREQISLNLLLDAVLEELMSPRRTNEDASLPDITELYSFLQSLHTGMNVNPRYFPTSAMITAFERTNLTHLEPGKRAQLIPGTFENTAEMGLYAAFNIPLIHGWLPPTSDPVHGSLQRQAASYEDAQNLLFREEELEYKLSSDDGLTGPEQQLYQDIMTIKNFLLTSATQLTSWGIEVISKAIRPGTFAILFRNDHFSTLYCHPQTGQLVTLVTDDGYRSHDKVVWESLVDVNGERTQYLSGDFKVVTDSSSGEAGPSSSAAEFSDDHQGEWTTVQNRRGRSPQQDDQIPVSPLEQEDRDLALALQLQEEEDQRHREEQARRQRERNMSEQVIEQQGRSPQSTMPNIRGVSRGASTTAASSIAPARRSSNTLNIPITSPASTTSSTQPVRSPVQQIRPMIPPRRQNTTAASATRRPGDGAAGDAPPPPYEQAAQDPAYEPPPGHPSHAQSRTGATQRQGSLSGNTVPIRPGHRVPGHGGDFRQFGAMGTTPNAPVRERERDCVVM